MVVEVLTCPDSFLFCFQCYGQLVDISLILFNKLVIEKSIN